MIDPPLGSNDLEVLEPEEAMELIAGYKMNKTHGVITHKLDAAHDHLIISAHGPDRVGLIHTFAELCHSFGASISESKMVRMGGQFMVMMIVSLDPKMTPEFRAGIQQQLGDIMDVSTQDITEATRASSKLPRRTTTRSSEGKRAVVHVKGPDRPGITADVTRCDDLARRT